MATVTLKSVDTEENQAATTGAEGTYRFKLLKPGHYEVTVEVPGFAKRVRATAVEVGQTSQVDLAAVYSELAMSAGFGRRFKSTNPR